MRHVQHLSITYHDRTHTYVVCCPHLHIITRAETIVDVLYGIKSIRDLRTVANRFLYYSVPNEDRELVELYRQVKYAQLLEQEFDFTSVDEHPLYDADLIELWFDTFVPKKRSKHRKKKRKPRDLDR